MKLFVKAVRNSEYVYFQYQGLTADVVFSLLVDLGCSSPTLITEEEYAAYCASLPIR